MRLRGFVKIICFAIENVFLNGYRCCSEFVTESEANRTGPHRIEREPNGSELNRTQTLLKRTRNEEKRTEANTNRTKMLVN